jgi:hypothetical protein
MQQNGAVMPGKLPSVISRQTDTRMYRAPERLILMASLVSLLITKDLKRK